MTAPYTSELAEALAADVLERLLRYVRIDTQSDPAHAQSPSTPGQLELARLLVDELHAARARRRRDRRERLRDGDARPATSRARR